MPLLCNHCNTLMAFRLVDEPCERCQTAAQSAAAAAERDDCSTLQAFGWDESACESCRTPVAA